MRTAKLIIATLLFSAAPFKASYAATRHVDINVGSPGVGAAWNSAYQSLSVALAASSSGDVIKIAGGTYYPGTIASDTFLIPPGVSIRGGYAGDGAPNPDAFTEVTVLSGDFNATNNTQSDDSTTIVTLAGPSSGTATTTLRGLTIEESWGDSVWATGVLASHPDLSVTMQEVLVQGCQSSGQASGMFLSCANITLLKVTVLGNSQTSGGAPDACGARLVADLDTGVISIDQCTFQGNGGGNYAGAAWCSAHAVKVRRTLFAANGSRALFVDDSDSTTVARCVFADNQFGLLPGAAIGVAGGDVKVWHSAFYANGTKNVGGAIAVEADSAQIVNCLFSNNQAAAKGDHDGGGVWIRSDATTITNCTFFGNYTDGSGGAMWLESENEIQIGNTIVWCSTAQRGDFADIELGGSTTACINYSNFQTLPDYMLDARYCAGATGNISQNPQWVGFDAMKCAFTDQEECVFDAHTRDIALFQLSGDPPSPSPCVNAGSNAILESLQDPLDIDDDMDTASPCSFDLRALCDGLTSKPRYVGVVDMGAFETHCNADFNKDGATTVADIFAFLTAWFASHPSADYNGIDGVTVADIFAFLTDWFSGC